MKKRNVWRRVASLVCSFALLLPTGMIGTMASEPALVVEDFESYTSQSELDAVWIRTGSSKVTFPEISTERSHSGSKSLYFNDTEANASLQVQYEIPNSYGIGTEFIVTAYYYVDQLSGGKTNPSVGLRSKGVSTPAYTYSTGQWDRLSAIRTTSTKTEKINIIMSTTSANVAQVYIDDVTVCVLTESLALDYIEEKLAISGTPDLPAVLASKALSLNQLHLDFVNEYATELKAQRDQKGSALTKAEVQACVDEVNTAYQTFVEQMATEVPTSQTLSRLGDISIPAVSSSEVTLAWTAVTGDTNNRIQMLDGDTMLISQPNYGAASEQVTMTLTLSKGPASAQVNVATTISPYTQNMMQLIEAAEELDISSSLNGQAPNWVISDLVTLPTTVTLDSDAVDVSWNALDANTLGAAGAMTNEGEVARGAYGTTDTAVILRATLSKGEDSHTRDFHLIVPSLDAEDARNMITVNPGFESSVPPDETSEPEGWLKHTKWVWGDDKIATETTYAQIDEGTSFTGAQSLRITVDETMAARIAQTSTRTASVQNNHVFSAREGNLYTLQVMAYTRKQTDSPSVSLVFLDNEGIVLAKKTCAYYSVSHERAIWKNLSVSACAPAGTVMAAAVLDGGAEVGTTWFDNVRLRELPLVSNGSFELGTVGWTTSATASNGTLVLDSGVAATSAALPADRGVAYYLSVEAQGSGVAALRFLDSSKATTLAEYEMNISAGTNTCYAYAPTNTGNMAVVLTGGAGGLTVDDVKIARAPSGTYVADGNFESSAGTAWDLNNAAVGASTGRSGAGLTITGSGSARSAIIPIMDGKNYAFAADVKGAGTMTVELYRMDRKTSGISYVLDYSKEVTSSEDEWNTIRCSFDPVPEGFDYDYGYSIEHAYAQVCLSGEAVFDNVAVYSVTDSVSNASMENLNNAKYGSFPYNWSSYGPAAGFVANQEGQATEGIKSLGVELFGLGEGGVRSSMIPAEAGKDYEATVNAKGSGFSLHIEFWDENFVRLDNGADCTAINTESWNVYSVTGTAPVSTAFVSLSVSGSGSGLAYVDQASIVSEVRNIGSNVQLFLDDWLVQDSSNVQRTYHAGEKMDEIKVPGWYGTVVWNPEKQLYEMWHQMSGGGLDIYSVYYRTSPDGVSWSDGTLCERLDNSTIDTMPSPTVFLDLEEENPAKRYKLVCHGYGTRRYALYTSQDGINWNFETQILPGSDVIKVAYDAVNKEYVATYKTTAPETNTKRSQNVAVSKDLINWSESEETLHEGVRMYSVATPQDMLGGSYLRADSYGTAMYPLGDSYVAINWLLLLNENDGFSGEMKAPLLFSRDLTEDWQRIYDENGDPFMAIPRGEKGEWDDAQIYANSYPVQVGDETWWYYDGSIGGHFSTVPIDNSGYISAAKWRRNGFASMDFGTNGTMTTEQFILIGEELRLNAKGDLTVELLDKDGIVLATAQFEGDSVDQALVWNNSVTDSLGQPVSLRFTGSNAELYSLQMTYDIRTADVLHGTVTLDHTAGAAGTQVTVTATPVNENYKCQGITVTGESGNVDVTKKGDGIYTFTMPAEAVTVCAEFVSTVLFHAGFDEDEGYMGEDGSTYYNAGGQALLVADSATGWAGDATATVDNGSLAVTLVGNTVTGSNCARLRVNQTFSGNYRVKVALTGNGQREYTRIMLPGIQINGENVDLRFYRNSGKIEIYAGDSATVATAVLYTGVDADDQTGAAVMITVNEDNGTVKFGGTRGSAALEAVTLTESDGLTIGDATIIVESVAYTTSDGTQTTRTTYLDDIIVNEIPGYAVSIPTAANGGVSVTANGSAVNDCDRVMKGDVVTVTAIPANGDYKCQGITVTGEYGKVNVTKNSDDTYTFIMPAGAVTVTAEFVSIILLRADFNGFENGTNYLETEGAILVPDSASNWVGTASAVVKNGALDISLQGPLAAGSNRARLKTTESFSGNYEVEIKLKGNDRHLYSSIVLAGIHGKTNKKNLELRFTRASGVIAIYDGSTVVETIYTGVNADDALDRIVTITVNKDAGTVTFAVTQDGTALTPVVLTNDDMNIGSTMTLLFESRGSTASSGGQIKRTMSIDYINVAEISDYAVSIPNADNGSVSVTANGNTVNNSDRVMKGDVVTVTAIPANEDYWCQGITVTGESGNVPVTENGDGTYAFTMPAGAVTVTAEFASTTLFHASFDGVEDGTNYLETEGALLVPDSATNWVGTASAVVNNGALDVSLQGPLASGSNRARLKTTECFSGNYEVEIKLKGNDRHLYSSIVLAGIHGKTNNKNLELRFTRASGVIAIYDGSTVVETIYTGVNADDALDRIVTITVNKDADTVTFAVTQDGTALTPVVLTNDDMNIGSTMTLLFESRGSTASSGGQIKRTMSIDYITVTHF